MIEVKNLTKTYHPNSRNANTVLDKASLTLPDTGLIAIVGKSGIGKSTILNAIGGLTSYKGEILYDGKKVNIEEYRRKSVGYIFQDFLLFPDLSIKDNIGIGLNIAGIYDDGEISRRVKLLLKAVGLNVNPNRSASALSLGQRQRIAIARALASNPRIILCDEPTGNLDSRNSLNIMDILKSLSKDHLIIMVTHNVNLVNLYADRAYAIENKVFREINPKDSKVDEIYVKNQVNVATLTKKDIQSEHVLLHIYSDPDAPEQEITLICKDGKIMVVGSGVEIASPKDVRLVDGTSDTASAAGEKAAEERPDDNQDIAEKLKFEAPTRTQHRPMLAFRHQVRQIFLPDHKKKTKFLHKAALVLEVLIPLQILLSLNVGLGESEALLDTSIHYSQTTDQVALIFDNGSNMITSEITTALLSDPESHFIAAPQENYAYTLKNSLLGFELSSSTMVSSKVQSTGTMTPYYGFSSADFSLLAPEATGSTGRDVTCGISSFRVYRSVVPGLMNYELADNEVILDSSLLESSCFRTERLRAMDLRKELIGTTLDMSSTLIGSWKTAYIPKMDYVIKGIVDSGFSTIYASDTLVDRLRPNSGKLVSTVSYDDFDILNYDDVKDSTDYNFSDLPTPKDAGANKDDIFAYMTKSAMDVIHHSLGNYYGNIYTCEIPLKDKTRPDKKIIVLRDHDDYKSYQDFFNTLIRTGITENFRLATAEEEKAYGNSQDILIPTSLADHAADIDSLTSEFVKTYGYLDNIHTYPADNYDAKIVLTHAFYNGLVQSAYGTIQVYSTGNIGTKDRKAESFNLGAFFVSDDTSASIQYLKDHIDDYHLEGYRLDKAQEANLASTRKMLFLGILSSIGVITVVFILILILDSISRINREKYRFGVLRCLGMTKQEILWDDLQRILANSLFLAFVPSVCIMALLMSFNLWFLGSWFAVFLLAYFAVVYITSLIPLLLVLRKKPIEILRSLN